MFDIKSLLSPEGLMRILAIVLALTVHESSHALAALWLGDTTAKERGRISLNPLRHIDPIGVIMLLVAGFGWAKPVMVDNRYFKNQKRDMAITALAGPCSNFLLAFVSLVVMSLLYNFAPHTVTVGYVFDFLIWCAVINIGLGVFNLFPIPPLDGSKILGMFLPDRLYYTLMRYEKYGMLLLAALLFTGILNTPLSFLRNGALSLLDVGNLFSFGSGGEIFRKTW